MRRIKITDRIIESYGASIGVQEITRLRRLNLYGPGCMEKLTYHWKVLLI